MLLQKLMIAACSFSVSVTKSLIAITTGTPNFCIFSTCFARFLQPLVTASTFSALRSSFLMPPCIFNALVVATNTTASGFKPDFLHLISKNFSAPRSAPKPASVTT